MLKHALTYGFSVFAMFFGSGNLVFPLQLGIYSNDNWIASFIGLFLTGILLPILGLFAVTIHKGNYNALFSEAGSIAQKLIPFFALSLLGSFGIVPRCITVAYGGLEHIISDVMSSKIFSFIFCLTCWICCLNDRHMVSILGKWLTPVLLCPLLIVIIYGAVQADSINYINYSIGTENIITNFISGFITGYETMDLFASFFFSSLIFTQIQHCIGENQKEINKLALKANIIGAGILSVIYIGLVYLGACYSNLLINVAPELYLSEVTLYLFGKIASLIVGIIILLSCFTTAVALNNIYARYLCNLFNISASQFPKVLAITTFLSFIISMLDFKGINNFLIPLLRIAYPSLIGLTFLSIFVRKNSSFKIYMFYSILFLTLIY
ncbi:MAG: hypothetical protein EOP33_04380 [Rickettsiaceae bacterium]|nr:MAG: hypothetical protein EOP33_04380 [Rickettsiaceae bacterium]